jgi:hypothetical protein
MWTNYLDCILKDVYNLFVNFVKNNHDHVDLASHTKEHA